jgi:F-type H+-transporting ATPase subunit b
MAYLFALDLMELRPGLIFWQLVTFGVLFLLLRWKAWGPILALVAQREKTIQDALDSAKRDREQAEKLLAEQQALALSSRKEAAEAVRAALADAEIVRQESAAKSRKEAEAFLASARQAIAEEKAKAQAELKGLVVDLAIDVATKFLGETLEDPARQRASMEKTLAELPRSPRPS